MKKKGTENEEDDKEKKKEEDEQQQQQPQPSLSPITAMSQPLLPTVDLTSIRNVQRSAKADVLTHLRNSNGDTQNPRFRSALKVLSSIYLGSGQDARYKQQQQGRSNNEGSLLLFDATWMTLSKPTFPGCIGTNKKGEFVYSLGRMSFDMFRPINLKCSIRNVCNEIRLVRTEEDMPISVPRGLRGEVGGGGAARSASRHSGDVDNDNKDDDSRVGVEEEEEKKKDQQTCQPSTSLRTYNIIVNFAIEPKNQLDNNNNDDNDDNENGTNNDNDIPTPSSPIRAVMTNEGYTIPDPNIPNRFTVWFTGGELAPYTRSSNVNHHHQSPLSSSTTLSSSSAAAPISCCSLTLHECRKKSHYCVLHGVSRSSRGGRRRKKTTLGLPSNNTSSLQWEDIFGTDENWKRRSLQEKAKVLAAKMFLGATVPERMEEDGTMRYTLNRPIGRHGSTYIDVLYLDDDLLITRGNAGSIFVQVRKKTITTPTTTTTTTMLPSPPSSSSSLVPVSSRHPERNNNNGTVRQRQQQDKTKKSSSSNKGRSVRQAMAA